MAQETTLVTMDVISPGINGPKGLVQHQYALNIEKITSGITRMPVLFGIPGDMDSNDPLLNLPKAWGLDIGMMQEFWEFSGATGDFAEGPLAPSGYVFATKSDLDLIARTSGTGSTGTITHIGKDITKGPVGVIMHVGSGSNQGAGFNHDFWDLPGFVLSLTSQRVGAQLVWDYSLRIGITNWSYHMMMSEFNFT